MRWKGIIEEHAPNCSNIAEVDDILESNYQSKGHFYHTVREGEVDYDVILNVCLAYYRHTYTDYDDSVKGDDVRGEYNSLVRDDVNALLGRRPKVESISITNEEELYRPIEEIVILKEAVEEYKRVLAGEDKKLVYKEAYQMKRIAHSDMTIAKRYLKGEYDGEYTYNNGRKFRYEIIFQ